MSIPVNSDIHGLLGDGQAAGDNKLLDTLRDITDKTCAAARPPTRTRCAARDLARLDANLDKLDGSAPTSAPARTACRSRARASTSWRESSREQLSETEDVDMAEA